MDATGWMKRVPLGPVAALLLGGAGAFVAWALPAALIGGAVRRLHVTRVLPMAAPPYSPVTRIGLAVLAGIVLAAAVLLLFRWLEKRGGDDYPYEAEAERAPILRRLDRHPDAPARRPLFAGELTLDSPLLEKPSRAREPLAGIVEVEEPWPLDTRPPLFVAPPADLTSGAETQLEDEAAPPFEDEPAPVALVADPEPVPPAPPRLARMPQPIEGASIAELIGRLEAGLARREEAAPAIAPVPLGDALRDALADLQQMARR